MPRERASFPTTSAAAVAIKFVSHLMVIQYFDVERLYLRVSSRVS